MNRKFMAGNSTPSPSPSDPTNLAKMQMAQSVYPRKCRKERFYNLSLFLRQ